MSLPPLRKPKNLKIISRQPQNQKIQFVIITLKSEQKLVIPSDAYHGILMAGELYKCIFCDLAMDRGSQFKEQHKKSARHLKVLERFPHIGDFSENLLRKINTESYHCSTCNVLVSQYFIRRHIDTEAHREELDKARNRASIYKPVN